MVYYCDPIFRPSGSNSEEYMMDMRTAADGVDTTRTTRTTRTDTTRTDGGDGGTRVAQQGNVIRLLMIGIVICISA